MLVVGGGYGGATAAKYMRLLSGHTLDVVLVEPDAAFVSCPMSNLVLGGSRTLADITMPYAGLERTHGVRVVQRQGRERSTPTRRIGRARLGARDRATTSWCSRPASR